MGRGRGVQDRPGRTRGGSGGGVIRETTAYLEGNELGSLGRWEAADLVSRADGIGRELKNAGVTTSQIRNFLDEVNRIEAEGRMAREAFDASRVVFLKVQLAYAAGREQKLKDFARLFSAAVDKVSSREDFDRLARFTEAVVAYHRFHGGSNR
jgi:CRISPR-associated protein Csm2